MGPVDKVKGFKLKYYHSGNPEDIYTIIETAMSKFMAVSNANKRLADYDDIVITEVIDMSTTEYHRNAIRNILSSN